MLAHLQNFDFAPLLVNFDWLHVCLSDDFDRYLVSVSFVRCKFDYTKLTFAQVVLDHVKVMYV